MTDVRVPEAWLDAWRTFIVGYERVSCRVERALAEAGLPSLTWYDVLWALRRSPNQALRMGGLSDNVLAMSRTGLTRLVDRIEAAGLVRREVCDSDRRGTWVVLTDEGRHMHARMWEVYAAEIERVFVSVVDCAEAEAFRNVLERMSEAARDPVARDAAA
jgi:DNA-binding MarR family transcriptional regulator